jgi:osmotically-inducible protein OsmY
MDAQRGHRGRGPKGYTRSDDRIREDVNDRLSDDYYLDASDIEVMVASAEVILTGTVNTRNDKRRAEDLAESVSGVRNVENRLRIGQNQSASTTMGTTDSSSSTSATARGRGATS